MFTDWTSGPSGKRINRHFAQDHIERNNTIRSLERKSTMVKEYSGPSKGLRSPSRDSYQKNHGEDRCSDDRRPRSSKHVRERSRSPRSDGRRPSSSELVRERSRSPRSDDRIPRPSKLVRERSRSPRWERNDSYLRSSSTRTSAAGSPQKPDYNPAALINFSEPSAEKVPKVASMAVSEHHAKAVQMISENWRKHTNSLVDVVALKLRECTAQIKYKERQAEYNKSSSHHDNFPALEVTQKKNMLSAEEEHKALKKQLNEKDARVEHLTTEAADNIVTVIMDNPKNHADRQNQEKLEERCRSLEETFLAFKQQFEDQKKFIDELKKGNQCLVAKHSNLEQTCLALKGQCDDQKKFMDGLQRDIVDKQSKLELATEAQLGNCNKASQRQFNEAKAGIYNLDMSIKKVTKTIAEITTRGTPAALEKKLAELNTLSNRVNDFPDLRMEFSKFKASIQEQIKPLLPLAEQNTSFIEKLNSLEANMSKLDSISTHVFKLAEFQQEIDKKIKDGEIVSKKHIEAIRDNLERLELNGTRATPPRSSNTPSTISSETLSLLHTRIIALEQLASPLPKRIEACELAYDSVFKASTADQWSRNAKHDIKGDIGADFVAINKRLEILEVKQDSTKLPVEFEERLKSLEVKKNSTDQLSSKSDLEERLNKLERQQRALQALPISLSSPAPSARATPIPSDLSSKLDDLGDLIDRCDQRIDKLDTGLGGVISSASSIVSSMITTEIIPRLEKLEKSPLNIDTELLNTIKKLPSNFQAFSVSNSQTIREQNEKIENANKTLIDVSAAKAVEIMRSQNGLLPDPEFEKRLVASVKKNIITQLQRSLMGEMESHANAVQNLESRVNNIKTGHLAAHMVDEITERFPNLHSTEASMIGFRSGLENAQNQIRALDGTVGGFRVEIDSLTLSAVAMKSMATKTKDELAELEAQAEMVRQGLQSLERENEENKKLVGRKLGDLEVTIDAIREQERPRIPFAQTAIPPTAVKAKTIPTGPRKANRQDSANSSARDKSRLNTANGNNVSPPTFSILGAARGAINSPVSANGRSKSPLSLGSYSVGPPNREVPSASNKRSLNDASNDKTNPRKKPRQRNAQSESLDGDDPRDTDFNIVRPELSSGPDSDDE